uniref:Extracellular globin n=1 Tax=Lamellibrachia luymesi TaxID=238240 RepID=A0A0S2MLM4_LAMLU
MRQFGTLLVLACGLSVCLASKYCSNADANLVINQWQQVSSPDAAAKSKLTGGQAVFKKLFALAPGAVDVFKRVNVDNFDSPEFSAHIMRVMGGLDILINYLNDPETLEQMLDHLAGQHAVREGVTAAAFELMANVLIGGLPKVVEDFNPDAWSNCLTPILNGIAAGLP